MSFDSRLLVIDPETGDFTETNKKTLADYLGRRTKAVVETERQDPNNPTTADYPTGDPDGDPYTDPYTPENANAYPIEESYSDEKQKKFAKEYELAKWTFPETLPVTRAMMGIDNKEKASDPKNRKNRSEMLKDVLTIQDVLPDPIDAVIAAGNGEAPWNEPSRISLAMQAEIGIKLSRNRFTKSINEIEKPRALQNTLRSGSTTKKTDANVRADASTWVSRSRAYRGRSQQSISHRNAAEMTPALLTDGYQRAMMRYSGSGQESNNLKNLKSKLSGVDGGVYTKSDKITKDDVREIESRLESQYVPFYLHDLRTNEILNFHAFVENVSDSYTANWNDSDGYGRMDPVQTYKNTTRSISVDFYIVSTSERDFDRVWWTVNRLVMMIYPQWSQGNELKGKTNDNKNEFSFIQPFSQTITSSPVVRLRVGDLIASNYSRFNLARNFGIGVGDFFKVNGEETYFPTKSVRDELQTYVNSLRESSFTVDLPVEPLLVTPEVGGATRPIEEIDVMFSSTATLHQGSEFISKLAGLHSTVTVLRGALGKVIGGRKRSDGTTKVIVRLKEPVKINTLAAKAFGSRSNGDENSPKAGLVTHVAVNPELLYYNATSSDAQATQTTQVTQPDTNSIINENFANPSSVTVSNGGGSQSNAIVRSFEDSYGRGLAGSVRSLSFDWNEAPWETSQGSRAPIWCKVSMQFNPIHDIPMGLDHEGMPRAVPYPVGETVRSAYFPELHEQSKNERATQVKDSTKFWDAVGERAEAEVNGYLGKSLKRLF